MCDLWLHTRHTAMRDLQEAVLTASAKAPAALLRVVRDMQADVMDVDMTGRSRDEEISYLWDLLMVNEEFVTGKVKVNAFIERLNGRRRRNHSALGLLLQLVADLLRVFCCGA